VRQEVKFCLHLRDARELRDLLRADRVECYTEVRQFKRLRFETCFELELCHFVREHTPEHIWRLYGSAQGRRPPSVRLCLWQKVNKSDTRDKALDYHGACSFGRVSPDVASQGIKSLNIEVPFEEALKLHLALDSCLHAVNGYNRSTSKGRAMGVVLSVKTESSSIAVIEAVVHPANASPAGLIPIVTPGRLPVV